MRGSPGDTRFILYGGKGGVVGGCIGEGIQEGSSCLGGARGESTGAKGEAGGARAKMGF